MRVALKAAIYASGKSQRRLAAECDIPENGLSEIVCGWTDPRDEERASILKALGCTPEVFNRDAIMETRSR